jgi:hypothetical protein
MKPNELTLGFLITYRIRSTLEENDVGKIS